MIEYLLKLEMSFYLKETLENKMYMNQLLHDDFRKIGSCGKIFLKKDFLDYKETTYQIQFPFKDLAIKECTDGTFLITYDATYLEEEKQIKSKKSSLWVCDGANCQMIYHQGTYSNL